MSCSRLAVDSHGHAVVIVTTPPELGRRFLVVDEFTRKLRTGRLPTPKEMAEARPPYVSPATARRREERDEGEWMDEKAALEAARLEQQREPVDLIGRAA
jgi:hypothetical protein